MLKKAKNITKGKINNDFLHLYFIACMKIKIAVSEKTYE